MHRSPRFFAQALALIGGAISVTAAHSAVIQGVTINAVSSEFLSGGDQRRATNLVNGCGLFGEFHTATASGSMWLTFPSSPGSVVSQASVTFDLGAVHAISRMKVWNYNEVQSGANILTRRGIKACDILVAGEDQVFTTNIANQTFTRASGVFSNLYDVVNMGGVSARYVRINCRTNYSTTENDFRVGLSKVLFLDDTVPPTVQSATRNFAGNRVTVQFSETIESSSALNLTNYSIASGTNTVAIVGASLNTFSNRVELSTGQMDSNLVYTLTAQNVRDAANTISISSTQLNIDPELVLWLKADAGVTADGSGFVSEWDDQSGFTNNALGTVAPTLVPTAVNGLPAIHFDGSSQLMDIPSAPSLVDNGDLSVLAVVSVDSLTTSLNHNVMSKTPANQPASFDLQVARTSGKPNFVRGNGSSSSSATGNAPLAANQFYIVEAVVRGTNGTFYLNGNFNGSGTYVAGLNDSGNSIRLGIRQDNGTKLQGSLAEALVFRAALSDSERSQLENYLGAKYGISVVPLAITSQPANQTRLVGQTATFAVTAVAGSPNIFYQWQKNSVNIPNATNSLYTTPTLNLSDNNSTFRVLVYTSLGITNTSTSATLTVVADTQPPSIYSATRVGPGTTNVQVLFSEPVNSASASVAANFTINNGASVLAAVPGANSNIVLLTTTALDPNSTYQLTAQNINDAFNNTMSAGSVPVLPGGAAVWIRSDAGVLTNGSGLIFECADQSTNKNTAVQYGAATRMPTLVPGAMNGMPVLRFDGSSNYLEVASNPSLALTNDMTVFVAANFADYNAGREILGKTLVNQPAPFDYYVTTTLRFYRGNGSVNGSIAATTIPPAGESHVLAVRMSGTSVTHFLDGANNGTGTLSTTITDAGNPLRIGARADLLQYMKGDIAEVLIFGSALSAADQKLINTYLGVKYFPFTFVQQPVDASVTEGQTASFSVIASQGGASFLYQWQRNNVDIPGATNTTYTTPVLSQADNGSTYRVTVFIPGTSTTNSAAATLTVSPDTVPPTISSAGKDLWNQTNIVVLFSEAVDPATATQAANYSLDNGAFVLSAVMGDAPNKVILTTSPLSPTVAYTLTVQNVNDLFNNTIAPASVPTGLYPAALALWLKADAGVTADPSGLVSQWADQSGNGNTAFQGNGSDFMPTLIPKALNGLPVLRFDPANTGATNYLACASSQSLAITGDLTIYAVVNFTDFTQNREIIAKTGGAGGNIPASFDYYAGTPNGFPLYRGNGSATGHANATALPSAGVPHIISVVMQGTSVKHYLDGVTNGGGTVTAQLGDNGDPLGIGIRTDLNQHMKGDLAELLLIGSAVSDTDRAAIDSYLASRYAILLGPPLRITVTAVNANALTLSWPTPNIPFALESTADLSVPSWTPVANTVSNSGGTSSVSVSNNGQQAYYRLSKE